ncbi:MAG: peptide deformylase [bacterium]|nr:peptide deformylase [bacterium]
MKLVPQHFFSEFKNKVLDSSYIPIEPLETLKARLTAVWLFQAQDVDIVNQAKAFIQKTSFFKQEDLARLEQFASQIKSFDELHLCSSYTNIVGMFLEYKLSFTTLDERKQTVHFHARYEIQEQICCFISQTAPLIRVTGDPILQKPGILFPKDATPEQQQELSKQIEHAKSVLIQTGGAGIAANQCAAIEKPYRFTIVGVFHDIQEHATGVARRYPSTKFPQAMVMVNPEITAVSNETQKFNHACLSVPCANRCAVVSPMEMSVKYQDPLEEMRVKEVELSGVDAVVLWHELTHIIYGKTYMDVTFEVLPIEELMQFQKMAHSEIQGRQDKSYAQVPTLTVPPFHFSVKVNDIGEPRLDAKELSDVLPKMTEETLSGLLIQANLVLKKSMKSIFLVSSVGDTNLALDTIKAMEAKGQKSHIIVSLTKTARDTIRKAPLSETTTHKTLPQLLTIEEEMEPEKYHNEETQKFIAEYIEDNNPQITHAYIGVPSDDRQSFPFQVAQRLKKVNVVMAFEFMFKPQNHCLWNHVHQLNLKPNLSWVVPLHNATKDFDVENKKMHVIGHLSIDKACAQQIKNEDVQAQSKAAIAEVRQKLDIVSDNIFCFVSSSTQPVEMDITFIDCVLAELLKHPKMQVRLGLHPGINDLDSYVQKLIDICKKHESIEKQFKIILPQDLLTKFKQPESSIDNHLFTSLFMRVNIKGDDAGTAADCVAQVVPGAILNQAAMEGKPVYAHQGQTYLPDGYFSNSLSTFFSAGRKSPTSKNALALPDKSAAAQCAIIMMN